MIVVVLHILLYMVELCAELMEDFLELEFIFEGVFELFVQDFFLSQYYRFDVLKDLIIQVACILLNRLQILHRSNRFFIVLIALFLNGTNLINKAIKFEFAGLLLWCQLFKVDYLFKLLTVVLATNLVF